MFFKRIFTPGHAHYSYIVGLDGRAFVIDPRLDYGVYLAEAQQANLTITHIFETHRNEDILLGSHGLAQETGAQVYISAYEDLGYRYGQPVEEGAAFALSEAITLTPLHTPGHTQGHLSYVLTLDRQSYMVFTGDCLFYGGVGRTDFYGPDMLETMTSLLHHSIYRKIAPLGPEVLVMPAHGAGSACGEQLDNIPHSSIGFELKHNKSLAKDKGRFLKRNARMRYKNPLFNVMEQINPRGAGLRLGQGLPVVQHAPEGALVIDLRDLRAFLGTHLPGSLSIPAESVASYAGWFVEAEAEIVLLGDGLSTEKVAEAYRTLLRGGYTRLSGLLSHGALEAAESSAQPVEALAAITPGDYLALAARKPANTVTLDVRQPEEAKKGEHLFHRLAVPLQELRRRIAELPADKTIYVVCASGERAAVAASFIAANMVNKPIVVSGGVNGLRSAQDNKKK